MSTLIRPELSETNRYWIEKHRYDALRPHRAAHA